MLTATACSKMLPSLLREGARTKLCWPVPDATVWAATNAYASG